MEQIQKGPKIFQIKDNFLKLSYEVRKNLMLPKNFQAMVQPIDKQCKNFPKNTEHQNKDLSIPYEMSQSFIKYMLFYRIQAYLIVLSILLSIVEVYFKPQQKILILANNGITIAILAAIFIKFRLLMNHLGSKKEEISWITLIAIIGQVLLIIPHPTIFSPEYNHYLHLTIILRIYIILKFLIHSSIYCSVRAYRIININGLNASEHFLFAVKSLVESLNFAQILAFQFLSVLFFTHCLYLVGINSSGFRDIFSCFQIIMVSMPTVGFGEYSLPLTAQKVVLFVTVVNGSVLNSFVTLSMLKQLKMDPNQQSSYWLLKKIQARQHIESISKHYIQKSFTIIRQKAKEDSLNKAQINFSFKNQYRLRKSLYNSISYTDINNLFSYYRDQLIQLKMSTLQTANMISVLLRSLYRHQYQKQLGL